MKADPRKIATFMFQYNYFPARTSDVARNDVRWKEMKVKNVASDIDELDLADDVDVSVRESSSEPRRASQKH